MTTGDPTTLELEGLREPDRRRPARLPRRPAPAGRHRLRVVHPGGRRRGRPLGRRVPVRPGRRRRHPARPARAATATRSSARSAARRTAPRVVLIGHMDTVFDPGTVAERPFRIERGIAHGPWRDRHEVRAARRAVRAQGDHHRGRRAALRPGHVHRQPGRGDRLAELDARTSGRSPRTPMRAWSSSVPAPTATSCRRARASSTRA